MKVDSFKRTLENNNMSQNQLAIASCTTRSFITHLLKKRSGIKKETAAVFCDILEVEFNKIFYIQ